MSYFIFLEIRPLPLPYPNPDSYRERVIELRVDKVLFKIIRQYLFPITYDHAKEIKINKIGN
jgi:hypothetical protein